MNIVFRRPFTAGLHVLLIFLSGIFLNHGVTQANRVGDGIYADSVQFTRADSALERLRSTELLLAEDTARQRERLTRLGGLFALGRNTEAIAEWDAWIESERDIRTSLELMHWFARTLISSGDIQRARDILVECLAGVESPEDSMYFDACSVLLVDCYIQTGALETAIEAAHRYIQRVDAGDSTPLMLRHLGDAYAQTGKIKLARETWELLMESYPGTPEAVHARHELNIHRVEKQVTQSRNPDEDGTYMILMGSFHRADEADALYELLRSEHYPVIRKDIEVSTGPLTSLLIGPFSSRERALSISGDLDDLTGKSGSIILSTEPPTH